MGRGPKRKPGVENPAQMGK